MKRTPSQQASIEIYCKLLAEALNDAGFEIKKVMEVKQIDIPWTQQTCKELLWKPLQKTYLDKPSTTALTTGEVSQVYEVLNRHIATNFGVSVPFPCEDSLMNEQTKTGE